MTAEYDENFLRDFLTELWRRKWMIALVTFTFAVTAGFASYLIPKQYDAILVLLPVTSGSSGGGLASLTSSAPQLGGLASLAGVSLGGSSSAKAESLGTLQSDTLTQRYIEQNSLLPILFSDKWDAQHSNWKTSDPKKMPTMWKAKQLFRTRIRDVKENAKTNLVTLTITWTDPKVAAAWANGIVKLTNDYMRQRSINETERNIAYLNEQIAKTSVVTLRESIYSLMESEIKKQMIARGTEDYALKVIDPAAAPEKASSPNKILWVIAAFCTGLLFSSGFVFIRLLLGTNPYPARR